MQYVRTTTIKYGGICMKDNVTDILSSVLRRNNSSTIKTPFELLTQNRSKVQFIKSYPDDYILSIDDYPLMGIWSLLTNGMVVDSKLDLGTILLEMFRKHMKLPSR